MQPAINGGVLLGPHLLKHNAHSENSKATAGMQVDDFAAEFASPHAIVDTEAQLSSSRDWFESIDITAPAAKLGELCAKRCPVTKRNFGVCEKWKARIGAPNLIRSVFHGVSPIMGPQLLRIIL